MFQRPSSPSKFAISATDSPSKLSVPRKHRNQPSSKDNLQFATDITTSLLEQVRQLQSLVAERDEAVKTITLDKARLEREAEGFSQRLKNMDESEQRYKDESWSLETQTHELMAHVKNAESREQKLHMALAAVTSEKGSTERELDDVKQNHAKLAEDHDLARKNHEAELSGLRRNVNLSENERGSLQHRIDELTSQNQELAKAVAGRFRDQGSDGEKEMDTVPDDLALDRSDPEQSPPASPSKAGARHSLLETETLKSSLTHAHRMIQNLKGNVQREKSEKLDLKRLLQEARDELDMQRGGANKRLKKPKSQQDIQRKIPRPGLLGSARNSKTDVMVDDTEWEDHQGNSRALTRPLPKREDTDSTATETEDNYETANERETATESEAFQTGAESMAGDTSDDMTETEGGMTRSGTVRASNQPFLANARPGDRSSFRSTASTSGDEDYTTHNPVHSQPTRYRLKINRGNRRSYIGNETPTSSLPSTAKNSPAVGNNSGLGDQSLFAELGDMSAEEVSTPGARSIRSQHSTPSMRRSVPRQRSATSMRRSVTPQRSSSGVRPPTVVYNSEPPVPKIPHTDAGTMTESWQHEAIAPEGSRVLPSTPQNKDAAVQCIGETQSGSVSSKMSQMVTSILPSFGRSKDPQSTPTDVSPDEGEDRELPQSPETPTLQRPATAVPLASLTLSPIQSVATAPISPPQKPRTGANTSATDYQGESTDRSETPADEQADSSQPGILGSVFGWGRPKSTSTPQIAEDETRQDPASIPLPISRDGKMPLQEVAGNTKQRGPLEDVFKPDRSLPSPSAMSDHGSQTMLSSEQIDRILRQKDRTPSPTSVVRPSAAPAMKPLSQIGAIPVLGPNRSSQDITGVGKGKEVEQPGKAGFTGPSFAKRPVSQGSARVPTGAIEMPPLPPDHQQAIAAAAQKVPAGEMGPPLAPASSYRPNSMAPRTPVRSRTPNENRFTSPTSRNGTTPRNRYSTARSMRSRRSSVSSFESELDRSFNIRLDGMPNDLPSNTDPRMIQAITQTMVGEFLWKYTRKAGREGHSNKRHRRYFWVHPYTRTLYWSDKDPAAAGRAELKAKSVAIEAVRVVSDDNPMPPGLHRKSLVIMTPGRSVKFTANTSQRHDTWFNALSYLLMRTGPDPANEIATNLTQEDVSEFNPSYGGRSSRGAGSRVSLASFRSHGTQNRNAQDSIQARQPTGAPSASAVIPELSTSKRTRNHASISSRISSYWKPSSSVRGSMGSRTSIVGSRESVSGVYEQQKDRDSAEDMRQQVLRQENERELENVRACCDGIFTFHSYFQAWNIKNGD